MIDGYRVANLEKVVENLEAKVPDTPTTDETYVLKAVVLNRTSTYQWVLENV